jgi:hypothetical protein
VSHSPDEIVAPGDVALAFDAFLAAVRELARQQS